MECWGCCILILGVVINMTNFCELLGRVVQVTAVPAVWGEVWAPHQSARECLTRLEHSLPPMLQLIDSNLKTARQDNKLKKDANLDLILASGASAFKYEKQQGTHS